MTEVPGISRRRFLAGAGAAGAATVLAPQALAARLTDARSARLYRGGRFAEGVLAGDPTPRGITLWTRVEGVGGRGAVRLEVAQDPGFRRVCVRKTISTSESLGHAVKARISGLAPHERYFYRFETRGGQSTAGRFTTALPPDSNAPVRFACFSCQEWSFGYFNAHALLAREDDLDFVVNLGDYIYSDVNLGKPIAVRQHTYDLRAGFSAQTLDEYRDRYTQYRTDPSLRRVQARFPIISCWDDHEVQNDYAGGDPKGGAVTGDPFTERRKRDAYRAFFESMPHYPVGRRSGTRVHHKARFGRNVDVLVLDERQYRAAQPCGNEVGPACPDLRDPRAFLGQSQLAFARSALTRSPARWKVIANEVVIMPLKISESEYDAFDAWQGYPVEREAFLRTIRDHVKDVVFITGDYHAFIAGDVRTADGKTVASEFVGGSITSSSEAETKAIIRTPGFGTPDAPQFPPAELAKRRAANPWYDELDFLHHGYVVCEASRSRFRARFEKLETIRRKSTTRAPGRSWTLQRGQTGIVDER